MNPRYTYSQEITGYDLLHAMFNKCTEAHNAHAEGKITFAEYEKISEQYQAACKVFDELEVTMVKPKNETMELAAL